MTKIGLKRPKWVMIGRSDYQDLYIVHSYKIAEVNALKEFVLYLALAEDESDLDGLSCQELLSMIADMNNTDTDTVFAVMSGDGTVINIVPGSNFSARDIVKLI